MGIPNFAKMREQCEAMRAEKIAAFPDGSVVAVESERFHGVGIVSYDDDGCPLEKLPVRVESLNVWWYPIEDCQPYDGRMPSWMRGYMRSQRQRRMRRTSTDAASGAA
jgi:hypothetical protein